MFAQGSRLSLRGTQDFPRLPMYGHGDGWAARWKDSHKNILPESGAGGRGRDGREQVQISVPGSHGSAEEERPEGAPGAAWSCCLGAHGSALDVRAFLLSALWGDLCGCCCLQAVGEGFGGCARGLGAGEVGPGSSRGWTAANWQPWGVLVGWQLQEALLSPTWLGQGFWP